MTAAERKYLKAEPIVAWGSFLILLVTYWLTVAPTVSYWDCPEYVSAAALLEIGHPPGNPVWMLVERIVTMLAPGPEYVALAVNLSSGLFTAFAAFFLAKTIFRCALFVLLKLPRRRISAPLAAAGAALCGALCFGFSDSVWYSAVEAEVYAMSIFMTSLCLWLMTKWAGTRNREDSWRLLILLAYLFGLSIGIHQLNLLCIPALALIWAVKHNIRTPLKLISIFLLSLIAVGCILVGMMPSTISLAAQAELIAVNRFNLPALSGVVAYVALLGISLIISIVATYRLKNRWIMAVACYPAIFLSGIFIISDHFALGAVVSAIVAHLLVAGSNFKGKKLSFAMLMLTFMLTGYSSYALIPIRGSVASPANAAMPGDPFSFASYQSREQYGSKPLIYGPTPYSKPMLVESFTQTGSAEYRKRKLEAGRAVITRKEEGGLLRKNALFISSEDSAENARLMERKGDAYILSSYRIKTVPTPELSMWFPRITSPQPLDLRSYSDWVGMDTSSMSKIPISEAFDSLGNPVARMNPDGTRSTPVGYRPTYLQNLQWMLTYQMGYMYWRYLLWNFSGRQNDYPSTGEVQHGNFITGYTPIDNAMLGAESHLPVDIGKNNPGRNRYFMLPLLLGICGMVWLLKSRKRGMQVCAINAILFIMSGLAIVVYLNQDPGEPRERDYSFLGSYLAYCVWIAFGALFIARRFRSAWGFLPSLALVIWMGIENYDDHDRSGRYAASRLTSNILNAAEPEGIIFVNGDNYTFPLWYSQEVEGVRRDLRIINQAYINSPVYSANLMADWRDSKGLTTVFRRPDIIGGAFSLITLSADARDTLPAVEMLRNLRKNPEKEISTRFVTIPLSRDSLLTLDLKKFCRPASRSIDFGSLFTLDIVASNASMPNPRPVYWLRPNSAVLRSAFASTASPWIYGYKFGLQDREIADSLAAISVKYLLSPNGLHQNVYMDHTPATQISFQRASLVITGLEFLKHGKFHSAAEAALKADGFLGDHYDSFGNMMVADTIFLTRKELANLLLATADSLDKGEINSREDVEINSLNQVKLASHLRMRGLYHRNKIKEIAEERRNYIRALPPRLRGKASP